MVTIPKLDRIKTVEIPDDFDFHRFARKSMKFDTAPDVLDNTRVGADD